MNKLLFLSITLLAILFSSCKKDEPVLPTTIQIVNGFKGATTTTNSVNFDAITVFCYNSLGDLIQTINYTNGIKYGNTSNKIELMNNVEKVRIYISGPMTYYGPLTNHVSGNVYGYITESTFFYVQTYFYINKNGNLLISIDNNTIVSTTIWK